MTGVLALAFWAALAAEPAQVAPDALIASGSRIHLFVSEEVGPDSLYLLARPGVVLWLQTRSNAVKASTVARLVRFQEAYVELRSPVLEQHVRQLEPAPRAGVWVDAAALAEPALSRLGPRRRAVVLHGPLTEERANALRRWGGGRLRWEPSESPRLDEWALFAQLPGARVVVWPQLLAAWRAGIALPARPGLALWTDSAALPQSAQAASDGGWGLRVRVSAAASSPWLSALFARNPSAELELEVGSDDAVPAVRALLERVEASWPRESK